MKNILLLILLGSSAITAFGQTMPVDNTTGLITYTGAVTADGATQQQLYKAAKMWVLSAYSPGYVSQLDDLESFTIFLKPVITVWQPANPDEPAGTVLYSLTLECRNGKYRYTFTGFFHQHPRKTNICDGGPLENEKYDCAILFMNNKAFWASIKKQVNDNVLALVADMKQSMAKSLTEKKTEW
jgi:hypothetical protein